MGAWGVLAFDNDDANDWAAELDDDTADLKLVEGALAAVERERSGYLEQGIACEALAACEVLARLQGRPGYTNAHTSKVDRWVAAHQVTPPAALLARAGRVIDRITDDDSELRELWDEGDATGWLAAVADLRKRVAPPPIAGSPSGNSGTGRRFELVDDDHAKYWEVSRADASVTVHFGRLGTRGQVQTKQFASESAAMEHVAKLILEKRRKGYREVGPAEIPGTTTPGPASSAADQAPPDGPVQIGPVQLPAGHQVAHDPSFGADSTAGPALWISNEPVENAGTLVAISRRAEGTPMVAFVANDESPGDGRPWDSGEFVPGDPREIARFKAADVLAEMWMNSVPEFEEEREAMTDEMAPFGFTFPGLAASGSTPVVASAPTGFRRLFSRPVPPNDPWSDIASLRNKRIGVVAAQRPADIITVLGWQGAVNIGADPASMSAVLRSWEERFGAVVVEVGFDTLVLIVERPPQSLEHALAVAAEHYAFCFDNIMQGVGSMKAYAPLLVGRHRWEFWWD